MCFVDCSIKLCGKCFVCVFGWPLGRLDVDDFCMSWVDVGWFVLANHRASCTESFSVDLHGDLLCVHLTSGLCFAALRKQRKRY